MTYRVVLGNSHCSTLFGVEMTLDYHAAENPQSSNAASYRSGGRRIGGTMFAIWNNIRDDWPELLGE